MPPVAGAINVLRDGSIKQGSLTAVEMGGIPH